MKPHKVVEFGYRQDDLPEPVPTKWIIKGFLAPGVTLIGGPSGCGKSILLSELLYSVVTGEKFLGYYAVGELCVPGETEALYIDLERFENTRYFLYKLFGKSDHSKKYAIQDSFMLDSDADFLALKSYLRSNANVKLVIIDSLLASHVMKENSNEEMSRIMKRLHEISECSNEAAIVVLQHSRKASKDPSLNVIEAFRGGSAIGQYADGGYIIENTPDFAMKRVSVAKFNYVSADMPQAFFYKFYRSDAGVYRLSYSTSEEVDMSNSVSNRLAANIPEVLRDETLSLHDIAGLLSDFKIECSKALLHRVLKSLEQSGVIYQPKYGFYKRSTDVAAYAAEKPVPDVPSISETKGVLLC